MTNPAELEPLTPQQQEEVRAATRARIREGAAIFGRSFDDIPVVFDLRGRIAGQFQYRRRLLHPEYRIRYNPWVFAVDLEHHLQDTVAHEVAHYLTQLLYPRARPPGREWKGLMARFGATPRATSPYDLTGVPVRRQRRHLYGCGCDDRVHEVTSTRHNRMQHGMRYLCRQ